MTRHEPPKRKGGGRGTHSAPAAAATVTPARRAAFAILTLVGAGKGHSDELLHSPHTAGLSSEDRNLTTAIVMGVLRWQIALDAEIAGLLSRPDQRVPEPVAIVLRIGAFQLLHMDRIPAHAALSESVELCRMVGQPHATGMVNAILRKVAVRKPATVPIFESTAAFAERLGHPEWLVARWVAQYGKASALAICEYGQKVPGAGELFGVAAELQEIGSVQAMAAASNPMPQIDDGSRLVAELAAAAVPETPDAARVWDCCAAPGGKTLVLATRLPEADLLASDISPRRLEQMQARFRAEPIAGRVRTAVADASAVSFGTLCAGDSGRLSSPGFDLILCDLPCSGTGTLAHNPEIRLRLRPEELPRQAQRQQAILGNALRQLAPGGRLLYATCSLEPEENEAVLEAAVPPVGFRKLSVQSLLAALVNRRLLPSVSGELLARTAVRDDALRTLPGTHPCDGFFAAVFERS